MNDDVSCAVCGEPAACIGKYDDEPEEIASCDDCCGHSNEGGACRPLAGGDR